MVYKKHILGLAVYTLIYMFITLTAGYHLVRARSEERQPEVEQASSTREQLVHQRQVGSLAVDELV